ncbi:hypothetical protein ACIP69_18000 [Streptomyces hygroscopicus]|uniref:hypothetical protein n=1 Tax=Streptomyces hygroscopicus TaxID=1912 RepID=UPI00381BCEA9
MEETEGTPPMAAPAPDLGRNNAGHSDPLPEDLVHDVDRDPLSRLVREANDVGLSFGQMEKQAERSGYPVSKTYFQKMASNAVTRAPTPDTLRGMAEALRHPLAVVQRAAAVQYLDYRATELSGYDDDVRIIVAHLAGMKPGEKRKWRAMIEAAEQVEDD